MATPQSGPIDLYVNNGPYVPLTPKAFDNHAICLEFTETLTDISPIEEWTEALGLLAKPIQRVHPGHRTIRASANGLEVRGRPLCFKDNNHRNASWDERHLSPDQRRAEEKHCDKILAWYTAYHSSQGLAGLIRSPKRFPPSQNNGWHCCAVFVANMRHFIYDPHFNLRASRVSDSASSAHSTFPKPLNGR